MNVIAFRPAGQQVATRLPEAPMYAVGFSSRKLARHAPGRDVFDVPALLETAAFLSGDEAIELEYVRSERNWQLVLSLVSSARDPARQDLKLEALLKVLAPGAHFARTEKTQPDCQGLALRPTGVELNCGALGRIILGQPHRRLGDMGKALALAADAGASRLTCTLRPFGLSADDLQMINAMLYALPAGDSPASLTNALALALQRWRLSGAGVACDVTVSGLEEGHPYFDAIALALFGTPASKGAAGVLDLASAIPAGHGPAFMLVPPASGFSIRPTTVDEIPLTRGEGAIFLGLDLAGDRTGISAADRMQHLFVIGGTGTGKTTLLNSLIMQDIHGGEGVLLIDPHGDLFDAVSSQIPAGRARDVVVVDPASPDCPWGLDLFRTGTGDPEGDRNRVANQLISFFKQAYFDVPEAIGPQFELFFRNAIFLLMLAADEEDRSIIHFERVFNDAAFRRRLARACPDKAVAVFWLETAENVSNDSSTSIANITTYITSKMGQLTGNPLVRRLLGSGRKALDLSHAMQEKQVVLVKLSKGLLGDYDSRFLGALVLFLLSGAAMQRARLPEHERHPFRVYADEFQNLATATAAEMLAECRKFGISLTLANQGLGQLSRSAQGKEVAGAVLSNCASIAAFRIGVQDAALIAPMFDAIEPGSFLKLGVGEMIVRKLDRGVPQEPALVFCEPPRRLP